MSPSRNSFGLHCLLVYTSCSTLYWRQPQRGDGRTSIKFTTGPAKKQLYFMHRTRWYVQNSSCHPFPDYSLCVSLITALQFRCAYKCLLFSVQYNLAGGRSTLLCTTATSLLSNSLSMHANLVWISRPRYRWTVYMSNRDACTACGPVHNYITNSQQSQEMMSWLPKRLVWAQWTVVVTWNAIMAARRPGMSTVNNDWIISLPWPIWLL